MTRRILLLALVGVLAVAGAVHLRRHFARERAEARYAERHADEGPLSVDTLGTLPPVLEESSGLAVSRRYPGIYWTHNDSGDEPRFFAVDASARLVGTWKAKGAQARDWEDMDRGPCPSADVPAGAAEADTAAQAAAADSAARADCLYLADTGDNGRSRDTLTIYVVPEPDPGDSARAVAPLGALRFAYPDERHDVEAVAVDPDGDVVLVTKGRTPDILLYELPAAAVAEAVRSGEPIPVAGGRRLPIVPDWSVGRVVTGASFDPVGRTLAVRTYTEIFFLSWPLPAALPDTLPSCFLGTLEPQGEAVAWAGDGASLLLTSESNGDGRGRLLRVRCAAAAAPLEG